MAQKNYMNERFAKLRKLMHKNKLDGLIVTNNLDQFYLTNFFFYPNESVFLIHKKGVTCFTRELYVESFGKFAPQIEVIGDENRIVSAIEKARKLGLARPGFDAAKETYVSGGLLRASGFVEAGSLITTLRENKDAAELKLLRESNRIAYLTYEYIKPRVKTGMTEFEFWRKHRQPAPRNQRPQAQSRRCGADGFRLRVQRLLFRHYPQLVARQKRAGRIYQNLEYRR